MLSGYLDFSGVSTTTISFPHLKFFLTILLCPGGNLHDSLTTYKCNACGSDVHTGFQQEHTHLLQICTWGKAFQMDSCKQHSGGLEYPNSKWLLQTSDLSKLSLIYLKIISN